MMGPYDAKNMDFKDIFPDSWMGPYKAEGKELLKDSW